MAVAKVTKRSVEAVEVPPVGKRAYIWDDTLKGFGVMVTDRGVRSYLIQYRIGGRGNPTRRVTIGKHGSPWTAERARGRAAELLEQVRRRVDPFDAERAAMEAQRQRRQNDEAGREADQRLAFATFIHRYVDRYAKVEQPRSWRDTETTLRRDLVPIFGARPLTTISAGEISTALDRLEARGASVARAAYKALRGMFAFAVSKHLLPSSPLANMKPPSQVKTRSRVLTDAELRLAWLAAGKLGQPFGPLVRLLILTGQRLREAAELPWSEIDLDAARWLISGERSKNKQVSLVPLATQAEQLLRDMPRLGSPDANDKPVFVFTTTGRSPVSGFSKAKARLDIEMLKLARTEGREAGASEIEADAIAIAPWVLHDLRRTFASGCQRLGIKLEVTEALLNHVSGSRSGIVGVYQVYRYEDEKRAAMAAWDRHVQTILIADRITSNVITMERRA